MITFANLQRSMLQKINGTHQAAHAAKHATSHHAGSIILYVILAMLLLGGSLMMLQGLTLSIMTTGSLLTHSTQMDGLEESYKNIVRVYLKENKNGKTTLDRLSSLNEKNFNIKKITKNGTSTTEGESIGSVSAKYTVSWLNTDENKNVIEYAGLNYINNNPTQPLGKYCMITHNSGSLSSAIVDWNTLSADEKLKKNAQYYLAILLKKKPDISAEGVMDIGDIIDDTKLTNAAYPPLNQFPLTEGVIFVVSKKGFHSALGYEKREGTKFEEIAEIYNSKKTTDNEPPYHLVLGEFVQAEITARLADGTTHTSTWHFSMASVLK